MSSSPGADGAVPSEREAANLRRSEARYRGLLEAAPDGMVVVSESGEIVLLNARAESQFGYRRDELVGQPIANLIPAGFAERLTADGSRSPAEALEQQIGTGIELSGRRRDGTEFPIEIMLSPLESPNGTLITAAIRDISVRRASEAERTRLISAVEQTADAIWMQDANGVVTYVNAAFTHAYGYAPHEIVGKPGTIVDSGHQDEAFFAAIWANAAAGKTWSGRIVNRRKDASEIEVASVISAIRDREGQFAGYLQTDRDITHERQIERALEQYAHERDSIATTLAKIDPGGSPEAIAAAVCAELVRLSAVDTAWALDLGEDHGRVLAVMGRVEGISHSGQPLPKERARYLLERASAGPWADRTALHPKSKARDTTIDDTGLALAVYAPLLGIHGVVGVIGMGTHDPANGRGAHRAASVTGDLWVDHRGARYAWHGTPASQDDQRARIQTIVDTGAFAPFFQPIVEVATGSVVGYEALSRFTNGVPPDAQFAAAVRSGLGIELEMATLRAAISAAAGALPPGAYLSLNASPALVSTGALAIVLAGMQRSVVLEITEHAIVEDYAVLRADIASLGPDIGLAVDDAGAGYASLRHILELAPSFVKLDLGLIRGIETDPARQALVAGMAHFAAKRGDAPHR